MEHTCTHLTYRFQSFEVSFLAPCFMQFSCFNHQIFMSDVDRVINRDTKGKNQIHPSYRIQSQPPEMNRCSHVDDDKKDYYYDE